MNAEPRICVRCGRTASHRVLVRDANALVFVCEECTLLFAAEIAASRAASTQQRLRHEEDDEAAAMLAAASEEIDDAVDALLEDVMRAGMTDPIDLNQLHRSLITLLTWLRDRGNHASIRHVSDSLSRRSAWTHLPMAYGEILRTMGSHMRLSRWDADLARELHVHPWQLLAKLVKEG